MAIEHPVGRPGEGEVVLGPDADPAQDPGLALRVAAVAAEHGLPISRGSLDTMAAADVGPPDPWSEDMRVALVRVLATGPAAIPALEALDQRGLFVRLVPEWAAVRNRPQRNAYHRFTVDRHLLEAATQAAPLAAKSAAPTSCSSARSCTTSGRASRATTPMRGSVSWARWDHAWDSRRATWRFSSASSATTSSSPTPPPDATSTTPPPSRPWPRRCGDRTQLELLAALTQADSLATGPAAWGQWKAGLVADLVRRVSTHLAGEALSPPASLVTDRHRGFMRQVERLGRSIVSAETPTVTVVARDRPGLLSAVTGVFALRGLDVRSADIAGEDGFAVETFVVEPSRGRWPDFELVADQLEAVLRGSFPLEERLAEQVRTYAEGRRSVSSRPVEVRVDVDNAASAASTVVDVRAEDDLGLLHRITATLFGLDLDVVASRVSTLGHEVLDAFYVRDTATGGKVTDPEQISRIQDAVLRTIDTPTADVATT